MTKEEDYKKAKEFSLNLLKRAGIIITKKEEENMEVTDLGLGNIFETGIQIVVYVNTERVCAKELMLLPNQTCPQHRHPPINGEPGKEETFRCRYGEVYLYVPGDPTPNPRAKPPKSREKYYTVWHEIILKPGDQYTLAPDTWHWFQAGPEGAVVSEFSTTSRDEYDVFTDPDIIRVAEG